MPLPQIQSSYPEWRYWTTAITTSKSHNYSVSIKTPEKVLLEEYRNESQIERVLHNEKANYVYQKAIIIWEIQLQ